MFFILSIPTGKNGGFGVISYFIDEELREVLRFFG